MPPVPGLERFSCLENLLCQVELPHLCFCLGAAARRFCLGHRPDRGQFLSATSGAEAGLEPRRCARPSRRNSQGRHEGLANLQNKKLGSLLDLCVSSLRRGHANLLCIVPILMDDLRRGSSRFLKTMYRLHFLQLFHTHARQHTINATAFAQTSINFVLLTPRGL